MILSLVSFCTDIASEMLFPVMPLYFKEIGYSILAIGILEGTAELIAGTLKLYAGSISDRIQKRSLFVRIGYGISAFAKPSIGFLTSFWAIFSLRCADRIGKGIRTAPRDALLSDESDVRDRGKVFGFHRSMDTLGATLGPIISFCFLLFSTDYSKLFLLAFIPGIIAVALTFILKEKKRSHTAPNSIHGTHRSIRAFAAFLKTSTVQYKKMIFGFFVFALINGSNVFLLLRAKELGMSDVYILGAYILYNCIYALASYPAGALADTYGFKKIYLCGILIFACVYGVFGASSLSIPLLFVLFALYGVFSAIDDGAAKAWLSLHIDKGQMATGLGLHMLLVSLGFFIASLGTGLLWQYMGGQTTFSILSLLSLFAMGYFLRMPDEKPPKEHAAWERSQTYGR